MPRSILIAALAAVACSSPPPVDDAAEPPPVVAPVPVPSEIPAAMASVAPSPGALRSFGDWTVGCDNLKRCKAVALVPGSDVGEPRLLPSVERDAGADGAIRIGLSGQVTPSAPITISIDGQRVATGGSDDGPAFVGQDARRIVSAMIDGKRATIDSNGAVSNLSLAGASAALRYIDAEQGRAGTTAALVARGSAPDRTRAPVPPVIRLARREGAAAMLSPDLVATMRRDAACESGSGDPDTAPLGGGRTLALMPCSRGAYNLSSAVFIVADGRATPARFGADGGMNPDARVPNVVNASFDDGILSTFAKGRGLGDCGVIQLFAWDGTGFRLAEQREMGECRGSIDYITTWRAQVVR